MLVGLTSIVAAEDTAGIRVTAALDKYQVGLGEPFWLVISIEKPAGTKVTLPSPGDFASPLEVRDIVWDAGKSRAPQGFFARLKNLLTAPAPPAPEKATRGRILVKLTAWELGARATPKLALHFHLPDGREAETFAEPLNFTVVSALQPAPAGAAPQSQPQPADIKGQALPPFPYLTVFLFLAGLLLISGGVYLLVQYLKNRPQPVLPAPLPPPPLPPHEVVELRLKEIEAMDLISRELFAEYCLRLSLCLREFLELAYKVNALESTSAEVAVLLKPLDMKRENKDEIIGILNLCDLVIFARSPISSSEALALPPRIRSIAAANRPPEPLQVNSAAASAREDI